MKSTVVIHDHRNQTQKQIERDGRLSAARSAYMRRNVERYGAKRVIPASRTIAGRLAKADQPKPRSTIVSVGEHPDGFGKLVLWDASDPELALMVYLNAADPNGLMISGAKATDTIEFILADGLASFAEETQNEGVGALIGIVAAGANLGAAAFGAPEAAPLIGAAEKFATERFKEKPVKTKVRDPFGVDPDSGHKARQEGGVIISLPEAGQVFYSGNDDHTERWIRQPGTRDDAHLPAHVKNAFFLRGETLHQPRRTLTEGDFVISAWDHKFEDNRGFYRLHVLVKRGDGRPPTPVE